MLITVFYYLCNITFNAMKTKLGIVAVFFIVAGFGMIHGGSQTIEHIAIALMGTGIVYLLYLLITTQPNKNSDEEKDPSKQ